MKGKVKKIKIMKTKKTRICDICGEEFEETYFCPICSNSIETIETLVPILNWQGYGDYLIEGEEEIIIENVCYNCCTGHDGENEKNNNEK